MVFGGISSPERVQFSIVSNNFFSVLGITTAKGRPFSREDEKTGAAKIFLASDGLWKRNMGGSLAAIGKAFLLDGESFILAGVLPAGFRFPENCDIWLPLGVLTEWQLHDRISHPFWVLGRLRLDTTVQHSREEMNFIASQLSKAYPRSSANWRVRVTPLIDEFAGNIRPSLRVLSGAVLFILLVACASVANLLLARSERRQKEFAVRAALEASRGRLLCQSLIEGMLIVLMSTSVGLLLGGWALRAVAALSSGSISHIEQLSADYSVLLFAGVLAVAITIAIGTSSALQFSVTRFGESLREGPRSGINPRTQRLRNALVVAEVSITLTLLCGAGLMLESFRQLRRVDPGFNPEGVVTLRIALPDAQYPQVQQRTQFLDRLLAQVSKLPGVEATGAVSTLPLSGEANWDSISIADRPVTDWGHAPSVERRDISAGYFHAMGMHLVRGEGFKEGDANQRSEAVVINQCMADRFWPGVDPIGRRLTTIDDRHQWREVIGVVSNVKHFGLNADNDAEIYILYSWWRSMNLVVRGASDSTRLIAAVRSQITRLNKGVPVYDIASMETVISRSIASQRLDLWLLVCFAVLALFLSAIGIHGLLAFRVNSRRQEVGLRIALGASRGQIVRMMMFSGMKLVGLGLACGAVGALALTRIMTGLLYHVSPRDPWIFTCVICILALVGTLACWWPARRATQVDPVSALRFG